LKTQANALRAAAMATVATVVNPLFAPFAGMARSYKKCATRFIGAAHLRSL
jgi:hypothetical protein